MSSVVDSFPVYQPSGRVSRRALPAVLLVGIPAALLSGWLYAQALSASHWIPLSMFVAGLFSVVIAIMASAVLTFAHSRSARFNQVAGGVIGAVALWARWIITLSLYHLSEEAITFATSGPLGWIRVLRDFAAHLQTIPADQTSGALLALGWAVEALFIVTMAARIGASSAQEPYSETVEAWSEKDFQGELYWSGANSNALLDRLKQEGPAALLHMQRAAELANGAIAVQWWTALIEGHWVEPDPAARWLRVIMIVHTRDNQGKITSERTTLLDRWHVSGTDYASVAHYLAGQDGREHDDVPLPPEDAPSKERPTPVELMPALAALETENFAAAITLAQAHCQHPGEEVRADAHRLCALAHARLEHWDDAFEHYHSLFEIEPTAFNAMQLATTSVTGGQLLRGDAWFEKAEEINQHTREIPQPRMRTHFLSALGQAGELSASKPHLDWLADAYRAIKTTDDHRLWSFGLPFFGEFLRRSLPILRACCAEPDIIAWYESMRDDLDEQGQEAIDQHLAGLNLIPLND